MGRIPETELEQLKGEIAIERLVTAKGVALRPQGADLVGCCPFHQDDTPSLHLSVEKNLWHCFGACRQGGSVIDWVMKSEGVSFRCAVELLRQQWAPTPPRTSIGPPPAKSRLARLPSPLDATAEDRTVLTQVIAFYHATLKESPEALAYLQKRGLTHPELIDTFHLGFANRTLGYRLPIMQTQAGATIRGRLQRLGILRPSGHEHFTGSLIVPILNGEGQVTEVYGRKITDGLRPGTPLHLYLPGPHEGIWNPHAVQASKEIILCEALIDALTFWCAGYRHVTASYGVDGFTAAHRAALTHAGTTKVWIAYDRDDAGDRAAEALATELMADGIDCWRVEFPKGMDANAYALKVLPAEKSLGLLLRHAVPMGDGPRPRIAVAATLRPTPVAMTPTPSSLALAPPPLPLTGPVSEEPVAAPPPPDSLAASPSPPTAPATPSASTPETRPPLDELTLSLGPRRYRVRGLAKNLSFEQLKVTLFVDETDRFFVDTVDLYHARQRAQYLKQAARELGVEEAILKQELGQVLRTLEERQEQQITQAVTPTQPAAVVMADVDREAALALLRDPHLIERLLTDFARCGVVGEETNKLVGYLAAVSRKQEDPLAVIIQSSSAAGKTALMDAILAFMPPEDRIKYSALTGQSLFYMDGVDLKHKILALVEEQGATRASYALKLLQSEGELMIASTGKDPQTGRLVTQTYRVEGPVMILLTTTAVDLDEELLNRCLILTVDEDRAQTRAIHRLQRERYTREGLLASRERARLLTLHQHAQRLLRPLPVLNPYARALTFPDTTTRLRRDHLKYLTLIETIALLHQYQRPLHTLSDQGTPVTYVEVTLDDLALANRLAHQVLGRSLDDLPPQTRRFLHVLQQMVTEACVRDHIARADYRFSRKEVRGATGWSYEQVRVHLDRLVAFEYVLVHRGGRGQSFVYELLYDGQGQEGQPHVNGLLDVEALRQTRTISTLGGEGSGYGDPVGGDPAASGVGNGTASTALIAAPDAGNVNGQAAATEDRTSEASPVGHHTSMRG